MIPFHTVLLDLAQQEATCVSVATLDPVLPPDDYVFMEYYCEDLNCDCRRVFLQVVSKNQQAKVFASISYGWENERFYRRKMPWNPDDALGTVRGELDPMNQQSEFAGEFLHLFKTVVLDEPFRLRLRRHYRLFREELARRAAANKSPRKS